MKILIKKGTLIDPSTNTEKITDVLINNGIVEKIEENINEESDKIIDAKDKWILPGFIDVHVHLRDPGLTHKETIETGALSAAYGGFTTICAMPNTKPATDNVDTVKYIVDKAKEKAVVNVLPIGAITKGQSGEEIADIFGMRKEGICAISEDGKSVLDTKMLKAAMLIAKKLGIPVLSHCEDISLVNGGVVNEGIASATLDLKGISNDSESIIVARDIILAKSTNSRLHICHVSTKESVEIIREAKKRGINVSAEVCPHHFTLTDEFITDYDGNTKMNPPLRSRDDLNALLEGLKDNTIEIIATDHAPHTEEEKSGDYSKVPFGIVGFETAFALGNTELVEKGVLTSMEFVRKLTENPAKLLGIDKGSVSVGKVADLVIADPSVEYKIDVNKFHSKSKNSPFNNRTVKGKILYTIVNGNIVAENN